MTKFFANDFIEKTYITILFDQRKTNIYCFQKRDRLLVLGSSKLYRVL